MSIINFLHKIRENELNKAIIEMHSNTRNPNKITLLEIGAGTGFQAKILSTKGFSVKAIDLPNSAYKDLREFEITEYNGDTLPYAAESMDIVFSSNVLEHVKNIDSFLKEIYRVAHHEGKIIHILPSSSWRFWSILTYYLWIAKKITSNTLKRISHKENLSSSMKGKINNTFFSYFFPNRHGERGNVISEIYYFSEIWWKKKFIEHNYKINKIIPNELFYTDASLLGDVLPLNIREFLSKFLGSSCKIYVLEKI